MMCLQSIYAKRSVPYIILLNIGNRFSPLLFCRSCEVKVKVDISKGTLFKKKI